MTQATELVEVTQEQADQGGRAAYAAYCAMDPVEPREPNWGRDGYKVEAGVWQAVARAVLSTRSPAPEGAEPCPACGGLGYTL